MKAEGWTVSRMGASPLLTPRYSGSVAVFLDLLAQLMVMGCALV